MEALKQISLLDKKTLDSQADAYLKAEFLEEIKDLDLKPERIRIPTGGSTVWEFPNGTDKPTMIPDFDAQIIYHTRTRGYYSEPFSGGNNPPQCSSADGNTGVGDPGGTCLGCPNTLWGSKNGETGTACSERISVYFLRNEDIFPKYISLPSTSIEIYITYRRTLASQGKILRSVMTNFSLLKAESKTGIKYSVVNFTFAGNVSPEDMASTVLLREQIKVHALTRGSTPDSAPEKPKAPEEINSELIEIDDQDMPF